jgi:hypothetical protein
MADGNVTIQKEEKRGRGRPTTYTQEVADKICAGLMEGRTLRDVCRDEGMPAESTVRQWAVNPEHEFYAQYTRAREIGYHAMADELVEISDDGSNDWMEREGVEVPNGEHMQRSRLRVDTRKWLMSKALPKMYGDKTFHEHGGTDGGAIKVDDNSADARKVAFMLGRAIGRAEKAANQESDSSGSR